MHFCCVKKLGGAVGGGSGGMCLAWAWLGIGRLMHGRGSGSSCRGIFRLGPRRGLHPNFCGPECLVWPFVGWIPSATFSNCKPAGKGSVQGECTPEIPFLLTEAHRTTPHCLTMPVLHGHSATDGPAWGTLRTPLGTYPTALPPKHRGGRYLEG